MMNATYVSLAGRLRLTRECASITDVLTFLEEVETVFAHDACRCCGSKNVTFGHAVRQGYDFYEARCADCSARLQFGQRRDGGGLFPKRKDKQGNVLPDGGWAVWRGGRQNEEPDF